MVQNAEEFASFARRKLLDQASNIPAAPADGVPPSVQVIALPTTRSSGSFPAITDAKKQPRPTAAPQPTIAPPLSRDTSSPDGQQSHNSEDQTSLSLSGSSEHTWKSIIIAACITFFLIILAVLIFLYRNKAVATIGPWKTGLSGQLQNAFITGIFFN